MTLSLRHVAAMACLLSSALAQSRSTQLDRQIAPLLKNVDTPNPDGRVTRAELIAFISARLPALIPDAPLTTEQLAVLAGSIVNRLSTEVRIGTDQLAAGTSDRAILAALLDVELKVSPTPTIRDLLGNDAIPAEPAKKPATASFLDTIDTWFSVRRSFLDAKDVGRPATFAWSHYGDDDDRASQPDSSRLLVDAAVTLEPEWLSLKTQNLGNDYQLAWNAVAVYEAHTTTVSQADKSRITHRIGLQGTIATKEHSDGLAAHNFDLTFDYATDSDYRADVFGGTLQYGFDWEAIGIGRFVAISGPLQLRWRPYVGFTYGDATDPGVAATFNEFVDYEAAFGKVTVELRWHQLRITPECTTYWDLDDDRGQAIAALSTGLFFDEKERVSLDATYTRGERFPSRADVDQVDISLALKF